MNNRSNNKYLRLLKNTGIVFVGNAGSKFLTFLMLPFYTRFLTPAQYGITDLLIVYANISVGVLTCQMSEAIFLMPFGKIKEQQARYFSTGLIFLCLMFLVGVGIVAGVKTASEHGTFLSEYAWVIFAIFVLTALQSYCQQFSRSADRMVVYAMSGLVCVFVTCVASLILIPYYSLAGYIFAELLGLTGGLLSVVFAMRLWNYIRFPMSVPVLWEMLKYSLPIVPVAVMWWLVSSLCRPIVESYCGLSAVGILALSFKVPAFMQAFWRVIDGAWSISAVGECKTSGYERFYNQVFALLLWVLSGLVIVVSLFKDEIINVIGGMKYAEASNYVPILAISSMFFIAAGFIGRTFTAYKVSKYYLYASVGSVIAAVSGNVFLIPRFGLLGASVSTLVSWIMNFILTCWFAQRFTKLIIVMRMIAGFLAVSFVAFLPYWCDFCLLWRGLVAFASVGLMAAVYMGNGMNFKFHFRGGN